MARHRGPARRCGEPATPGRRRRRRPAAGRRATRADGARRISIGHSKLAIGSPPHLDVQDVEPRTTASASRAREEEVSGGRPRGGRRCRRATPITSADPGAGQHEAEQADAHPGPDGDPAGRQCAVVPVGEHRRVRLGQGRRRVDDPRGRRISSSRQATAAISDTTRARSTRFWGAKRRSTVNSDPGRRDQPAVGEAVDELRLAEVVAGGGGGPPDVVALPEHQPERLALGGPGDLDPGPVVVVGHDLDRGARGGLAAGGRLWPEGAGARGRGGAARRRAQDEAVDVEARPAALGRAQLVVAVGQRERGAARRSHRQRPAGQQVRGRPRHLHGERLAVDGDQVVAAARCRTSRAAPGRGWPGSPISAIAAGWSTCVVADPVVGHDRAHAGEPQAERRAGDRGGQGEVDGLDGVLELAVDDLGHGHAADDGSPSTHTLDLGGHRVEPVGDDRQRRGGRRSRARSG